jgi:hypothetical protein
MQSAARLAGKQEAVRQRDEARAALEALQQEVGSVLCLLCVPPIIRLYEMCNIADPKARNFFKLLWHCARLPGHTACSIRTQLSFTILYTENFPQTCLPLHLTATGVAAAGCTGQARPIGGSHGSNARRSTC